jgi:hypothetical protein
MGNGYSQIKRMKLCLLLLGLAKSFQTFSHSNRPNQFLLSSSDSIFLTENDNTEIFQRTGIRRNIDWKFTTNEVPLRNEIALLKSGVLVKRGEFCNLYGDRLDEIEEECQRFGMTLTQGLLIRRQLMVSKVVRSSWKLKDEQRLCSITGIFERQQVSLLKLAVDNDLPPVSIIRAIIASRVDKAHPDLLHRDRKRIVKSIISERSPENIQEFLSEWELEELHRAKEFDVVGYSEETETPILWEEALYSFLDSENISYVTEDMLRLAGMKMTPDCLLLDDCYINGQKVRWIDAKSFYASGLRENKHFSNSLKKQIKKYETEFGESGAVIFKHGFSRKLRNANPSCLFLDGGSIPVESDWNPNERVAY